MIQRTLVVYLSISWIMLRGIMLQYEQGECFYVTVSSETNGKRRYLLGARRITSRLEPRGQRQEVGPTGARFF